MGTGIKIALTDRELLALDRQVQLTGLTGARFSLTDSSYLSIEEMKTLGRKFDDAIRPTSQGNNLLEIMPTSLNANA